MLPRALRSLIDDDALSDRRCRRSRCHATKTWNKEGRKCWIIVKFQVAQADCGQQIIIWILLCVCVKNGDGRVGKCWSRVTTLAFLAIYIAIFICIWNLPPIRNASPKKGKNVPKIVLICAAYGMYAQFPPKVKELYTKACWTLDFKAHYIRFL